MTLRSRSVISVVIVVVVSVVAGYFAYRSSAQQPNRPPVALPDSISVHAFTQTPNGVNVLANDSDPDGDSLTVSYTTNTTTPYGTGNVHWTGAISFAGGKDPGIATLPYTVLDNHGGSASSYVTVNVTNSAPSAGWDLAVLPGTNNYGDLNLLANDSDPDGDTIQTGYLPNTAIPGSSGAAQYSINNGLLTVSRYQWMTGTFVVFYQVADSLGATSAGAIVIVLLPIDGANNAGSFCQSQGDPVNPTNGNMWIDQPADYLLPGAGEIIEVKRFYNSIIQTSGLFGVGWATKYDESVVAYGDKLLRLNMPDGRAVYFVRQNTSDPFVAYQSEIQGQIVKNVDNSYTFTAKDGRVHDFNSGGKLTRQTDWNGNQTTLGYDTNGRLVSVTDPVGRVLTFTPNSNGTVSRISDGMGTVADYEYLTGTTKLKTVTYPDGSKYKFEYDTGSGSGLVLLKTVRKHGTIGLGTAAGMAFLLATSASPVNAPSRCDPVYFPDNPLLANAAMGQALGMAGGYLYGRFVSPYVGRFMAGMGDDIITLGLPKGPAAPPTIPQPIPVPLPVKPPSPNPIIPNPYGKLGSPAHRAAVDGVADDIAARGLTPSKEFMIRTPSGMKAKRFADVVGLDDSGAIVEIHQIGRATKIGNPVARERYAIQDILGATNINPVFHSY